MKITYAARFAGLAHGAAALYTLLMLRPGIALSAGWPARQSWLTSQAGGWSLGWWLWMLAIFAWMALLATITWSYSPTHRVSTMLQSGLTLIAAVLAIGGVLVWMNLLPQAASQSLDASLVALVDGLALSLLAAALLMGGGVSAWIGIDLARLAKLPLSWLWPGILAGLGAAPSPLLPPTLWPYTLTASAALFLGWCAFLATRRQWPLE